MMARPRIYSQDFSVKTVLRAYSLRNCFTSKNLIDLGNKAISQIKLARQGYRIPPSYFIDFSFFDYFQDSKEVIPELIDLVNSSELGQQLSIRSSSNVEDSVHSSFAGFFITSLQVPNNHTSVKDAIAECYHSFSHSRYKELSGIKLGIIVQMMIEPKISGILFTDSPQNPLTNKYRIEYCLGRGDKLTGGLLTGDAIVLDKASGKIIQQEGNLHFSQRELLNLWQIAVKIEKRFRFPQDVEFVISKDNQKIYLLQSRPITAFSFTPEYVIQEERKKIHESFTKTFEHYHEYPIFSSNNISELFPSATPLGFSIFQHIFAGTAIKTGAINAGRKILGYEPISKQEQTKLFLTIGDQPRVNLLIDALTYRLQGIRRKHYQEKAVSRFLNSMRSNEEMANYPEDGVYQQTPSINECIEYFDKNGTKYFKRYKTFLQEMHTKKIPAFLKTVAVKLKRNENKFQTELNFLLKSTQRMKFIDIKHKLNEYVDYLRRNLCVQYVIVARIAFLSTFITKKELNRICQDNLFGLNFHRENNEPLHNTTSKILDCLLAYENCPSHFKIPNQSEVIDKVKEGEIDIHEFLEIFGHIGPLDIMQPRLIETDTKVLESLFNAPAIKPQKQDSSELVDAVSFYENCRLLNPVELDVLKKWINYAKTFMVLRERFKFEFLKVIYLIKRLLIILQKKIDFNDLIYYLQYDEVLLLDNTSEAQYRLVAMHRKAYHATCSLLKVKNVIKSTGDESVNRAHTSTDVSDRSYKLVLGKTIHFGTAEGYCLIATNTQEYYEKLIQYREEGIEDIIGIFKGLELSYCRLEELSGIVTENGGHLAHAATIAREHNIPYISNVPIDRFQDYYYVILDTTNNQVIYREP